MKTGIEIIAEERKRQISSEGWSMTHDLGHNDGELAIAASCYALPSQFSRKTFWLFEKDSFKPSKDRIRDLAKAGALIAAEIDRLQQTEKGGGL